MQRHVGLVTFSSEVSVTGDGIGAPLSIAGDRLGDQQARTRPHRRAPEPAQPAHRRHAAAAHRTCCIDSRAAVSDDHAVCAG